jgi:hypothetical protein
MKMPINKKVLRAYLGFALACTSLYGYDNAHFYKTARFHGLTMYDTAKNKTKIDVEYGYGSARRGYNGRDKKTELLDIYGLQNMLYITQGVTAPAGALTPFDAIATLIQNGATNANDFGKLSFRGRFRLHEFNIKVRHNIVDDFFAEVHLPVRSLRLNKISFQDKSPATGNFTQSTAEWVQVKNNLNSLFNSYGLKNYQTGYHETGIGDLSLYLGWQATSRDRIDFLEFISGAIKLGVLFPTGEKDDLRNAFSMPTGYNKHWGIPFKLDMMIGATKWLTFGVHAGALFFFDRTMQRRMRTNVNQSGFIKLAQGEAKFEQGALWEIGGHMLFDHFYKGLSAGIGYSYNKKEEDDLTSISSSLFSNNTVNNDEQYRGFTQHAIHLMAEYDFAPHMQDRKWEARLKLFYDLLADGKRVFDTDMFGLGFGADIKW